MSYSLTGEMIASWKVLHTAVQPELEVNPHLIGRHQALGDLIEEGEDLQVRQKALISELRIINRRRREVAVAGEDERNRLAAALRFEHGFKNEKLIIYGVKPRKTVRRNSTEETPPPETPEAPQPQQ